MKYEIQVSGVVTIEAPNVVKAAQHAKRVRLFGEVFCSTHSKHDPRGYEYDIRCSPLKFGKPVRKP